MKIGFYRNYAQLILGMFVGAIVGSVFAYTAARTPEIIREDPIRLPDATHLTSPLLMCGATERKDFGEYKSLGVELNTAIQSAISEGKATDISVYFRDFNGKWVGVNENETFVPASLMKLPLLIAYLKEAENNPSVLAQKFSYTGQADLNQGETFKSVHDLPPGTYTVDALLGAMINASDNNAMALLLQNINAQYLTEVYTDLGLKVPGSGGATVDFITPKQYSYFFRILYNATYLNQEYSQKALELLSKADFTKGIRTAVPSNTIIAHKFGERTEYAATGEVLSRELHDCGIVYNASKPYFLCVMTRGNNFTDLSQVLKTIAVTVQTKVHSEPAP